MHKPPTIVSITLLLFLASSLSTASAADEHALTSAAGTPLKVIVREPAALYREPDVTSQNEPVDVFQFFYLLPADDSGAKQKNGFVRVGTAPEVRRASGWLPADKAVEWAHAQVAGFTSFTGRQRVLFFPTAEAAAAWYRGEPEAEAKAVSREPAQKQSTLFPLLDIQTIEHERQKVDIYKVAYIHGKPVAQPDATPSETIGNRSTAPAPRTREELQRKLKLQIVVVLDTTISMQPWIDAMKAAIATLAQSLAENPTLKGRVELALVCYRDKLADDSLQQELEYVTKIVCPFTADHAEFQKKVESVRSATIGSEDHPEDMLAGLQTGLHDLAWEKAALKHLLIISDAPAQVATDGYKNTTKQTIDGIVSLAQPTGAQAVFDRVQIHGLRIVSEMADETREHFDRLTKGREWPGLHHAHAEAGDEAKFLRDLTEQLAALSTVTQQVIQGKADDIQKQARQATPGSDKQRLLGPPLEMLQATQSDAAATGFQEGYAIVLDRDGNRCLEPHVLASRNQLKLFDSALAHCINSLEAAGDPGNRNVQKIVQSLQVLATGINLKEDVHPDMPFSELLSKILGFPVKNPIFALTPKRVAAMTAKDFDNWKNQVRASQSIVKNHLENGSIWFSLGTGAIKALEQQAFIKVSDLP